MGGGDGTSVQGLHMQRVCRCVLQMLEFPSICFTALMKYMKGECCDGQFDFVTIQNMVIDLIPKSRTARIFAILCNARNRVPISALMPLVIAIIERNRTLTAELGNRFQRNRFIQFVCASICFELSKSRRLSLTFAEFSGGNLIGTLYYHVSALDV